uniref:Uncharacterized protein n=1 Tax=Cruciviridae sp. TaxID=1955495 RepID=A0A1S6LVJ2_9VIRU|nr:hypothetical protein [Cruciviridae sp.]AQU11767.1 hypothetical protein [Cruciviridae sp.]
MSITFGEGFQQENPLKASAFTKRDPIKPEKDWNGNDIICDTMPWLTKKLKRTTEEAEMGSASDTEEESIALPELHGITINSEQFKIDPSKEILITAGIIHELAEAWIEKNAPLILQNLLDQEIQKKRSAKSKSGGIQLMSNLKK